MAEDKTFYEKIKEGLDAKMIAIVILVISQVGDYAWNVFKAGADAEFRAKVESAIYDGEAFKDRVHEEIDYNFETKLKDPVIFQRVLGSQEIEDFAKEASKKIENTIVDRVLSEDSSRVSMVTFIGKETGLRDEIVLPLLAGLLKAWEDGELMTKQQADKYISRAIDRVVKERSSF